MDGRYFIRSLISAGASDAARGADIPVRILDLELEGTEPILAVGCD